MTHNFPLPSHFAGIIQEFVLAVIRRRPLNYMQFAAEYFGRLYRNENIDRLTCSVASTDSQGSETESLDSLDSKQYAERRKSVAAEHFNPEDINTSDLDLEIHEKSDEQKEKLKRVCQNVPVFKSLNQNDLMNIIDAMYEINVTPDQEIFKEGDFGDNFYIIESGIYETYITQNGIRKKVKVYENEGSFGELALLYNAPRAASVVARTSGIIWAVTRLVFRSVVLVKAHKQREMYNKLLEDLPMLAPLSDFERANLADALTSKEYENGDIILKEGDPGNAMYFVISGNVEIYNMSGSEKVVINSLGPGKYFGELALLSNQPRVATVAATETTLLAELDVKSFERLMGPCIEVMKRNVSEYQKNVATLFNL